MKAFTSKDAADKYYRFIAEQRAITAANDLHDRVGNSATFDQMCQTCSEYDADSEAAWSVYLALTGRQD